MKNRTTLILMAAFFAGVLGLWWAGRAGVPTLEDRLRTEGVVLPGMVEVSPAEVERIEIDGGATPIVLRRDGASRWRLEEPARGLAEASIAESLVRNLARLRRFADATPIESADAGQYGFDQKRPRIRLFTRGTVEPVAGLELGDVAGDRRYVRPLGGTAIEVVPAELLESIELPLPAWRERSLLDAYAYDVASLTLAGEGRELEASYSEGKWGIERPIRAPGDVTSFNHLVANLTELEAVEGSEGFVAEDVADFKPYGLDPPRLTITLTPAGAIDPKDRVPRRADVGAVVPGTVDRHYARRRGEDDVMVIDAPGLETLGLDPTALRNKHVLDLAPEAFAALRIATGGVTHELVREGTEWRVLSPSPGVGDPATIGQLLSVLGRIETAEFLPAEPGRDVGLASPAATIEIWERAPDDSGGVGMPGREPDARLELGPPVASIKGRYARLAGDEGVTLLLPSTLDEVLPVGPLAYRDRSLADSDPRLVSRIEIRRADGTPTVLETPNQGGDWMMVEPVTAPADPLVVRMMAVVLGRLRADRLIAEAPTAEELAKAGLSEQSPTIRWTTTPPAGGPVTRRLRLGGVVPGKDAGRYAQLEGSLLLFTLGPPAVAALIAEPRVKQLLGFDPRMIDRLVILAGGRESVVGRPKGAAPPLRPAAPDAWEVGTTLPGLTADRCQGLAQMLSGLTVGRFLQYDGPIAPALGLTFPDVAITAVLRDGSSVPTLRVGGLIAGEQRVATLGDGVNGAVFTLPSAAFDFAPEQSSLPSELFAP